MNVREEEKEGICLFIYDIYDIYLFLDAYVGPRSVRNPVFVGHY